MPNSIKYYTIGIDIDGVLNQQTDHFLDYLNKLTGKTIDKNLIEEIPVHLNAKLGVTELDERYVFNTREYWETIPVKDNAKKRIDLFQKTFGYNIKFFSYRGWPQYGSDEQQIRDTISKKGLTPLEEGQIGTITTNWLSQQKIDVVYNTGPLKTIINYFISIFNSHKILVLELGNPYISDTRFWNYFKRSIRNSNRFQGANLKGFKFFIEDTAENAIKLAGLCDYVFMFNEPYNKEPKFKFPKNVIRVNT